MKYDLINTSLGGYESSPSIELTMFFVKRHSHHGVEVNIHKVPLNALQ